MAELGPMDGLPCVEELDGDGRENLTTVAILSKTKQRIIDEPAPRRSTRDPYLAQLQTTQVQNLLKKIESNHPDTVVLKVKDHLLSDINSVVMDAIIKALWKNRVCQALYVQNHTEALRHDQLRALIDVLRKKMIWCLNIGENYDISTDDWEYFCSSLPDTNVTHLYVSEHVISLDLKNRMRTNIRENRKKHNKHCSIKNLDVIERCTHCWWNPINSIRHAQTMAQSGCIARKGGRLQAAHTATWKEKDKRGTDGHPSAADKAKAQVEAPWKFSCSCRETCSSYEKGRYHPVGRMFQCSLCSIWAHVACVLGAKVTDEDIEEMEYVLCHVCNARVQRDQRHAVDPSVVECLLGAGKRPPSLEDIRKKESPARQQRSWSTSKAAQADVFGDGVGDEGTWVFKCKCGEVCTSKEKKSVHPVGRTFQCTHCDVWSHVSCVLGEDITDEAIEQMHEAWCFSCKTKLRRKRGLLFDAEESGRVREREEKGRGQAGEPENIVVDT